MEVIPVILAGGGGSRLWPTSRQQYPKQYQPSSSGRTQLQDTLATLANLAPSYGVSPRPLVVCSGEHEFLLKGQISRKSGAPDVIIEPVARDTAPAVTLAALVALQQDRDGVLIILPAGQLIKDVASFAAAVAAGTILAKSGRVVAFGVKPGDERREAVLIRVGPTLPIPADQGPPAGAAINEFVTATPHPTTGDASRVAGEFLRSTGIFACRASDWLRLVEQLAPEIAAGCRAAVHAGWKSEGRWEIEAARFSACPTKSVEQLLATGLVGCPATEVPALDTDHRLQGAVIPLDAGWSEVAQWADLWRTNELDAGGNVSVGDVHLHDTCKSLVSSQHRLVAVVGSEDIVLAETADAVLVTDRASANDAKAVVEALSTKDRKEHLVHKHVQRPWGTYESIQSGPRYQVKHIVVTPGERLSLQMHHHRAEHWIVVRGTAQVTCGDQTFLLSENESTYIPVGVPHRLENPGRLPLELIEVQSGTYLGEDDIVRFHDAYGRDVEPLSMRRSG